MSDSNRDTSNDIGLASDVSIEVSHLVAIDLIQFRETVPLGVNYVLLEEVLLEWYRCVRHKSQGCILEHVLCQVLANLKSLLGLVWILFAHGVTLHVRVNNECGELIVNLLLDLVADDGEDIETR